MATPKNPTKVVRRLGPVIYIPGVRTTLDLGRDGVLVALRFHLKYTHTNTGVAPVGALFNQAARLIKRIETVYNGRDTPINVQNHYLFSRIIAEQGGAKPQGFETAISAVASAVSPVDLSWVLRLDAVKGRRQDDMGIDCSQLTQAQLGITWGLPTDLWTTNNGVTITNVQLTVEGEYLLNATSKVDRTPGSKTYGQVVAKSYLVRQLDEISQPVTGTQTELPTRIDPKTGLVFRSFLVATVTGEIADDSLIYTGNGNMKLKSGAFTYFDRESVVLRSENREVGNEMLDSTVQAGVFFIRPSYAGQITTMLDTAQMDSDLIFYNDVTFTAGNSQIWFQREAIRPLKVS